MAIVPVVPGPWFRRFGWPIIAVGLLLDMIANLATRDRLAVRQDLPVFGTIELDTTAGHKPALASGRDRAGRRRAIDRLKGS